MKHAVTRIISGGQTGADTGGLTAGRKLGLQTGGHMPKGFRRLTGCDPDFGERFGMRENASRDYPPRTFLNVKESDGTVRFASNFNSPGEICTFKAIRKYGKPYFDVDVNDPPPHEALLGWIVQNHISVLNVAGNSAAPLEKFVEDYLVETLKSGEVLNKNCSDSEPLDSEKITGEDKT
jgi:hypothetical protein